MKKSAYWGGGSILRKTGNVRRNKNRKTPLRSWHDVRFSSSFANSSLPALNHFLPCCLVWMFLCAFFDLSWRFVFDGYFLLFPRSWCKCPTHYLRLMVVVKFPNQIQRDLPYALRDKWSCTAMQKTFLPIPEQFHELLDKAPQILTVEFHPFTLYIRESSRWKSPNKGKLNGTMDHMSIFNMKRILPWNKCVTFWTKVL